MAVANQQRALQALMQSGQLGGQLQSADTAEAQSRATAIDRVNQFNAEMLGRNYGQQGDMRMQQAGNAQNVANMNTGIANDQIRTNQIQLPQQRFNNSVSKVQGQAGNVAQQAQVRVEQGQNTANAWSAGGQAVNAGVNAYQNNNATQAKLAGMTAEQRAWYEANH